MMNESVLNTGIESQYRLLLLLSELPEGDYSCTWLSALDFIVVYGAVFNVTETNLHGDNWMKFTEYFTRTLVVNDGLRNLAFKGWVKVTAGETGFRYGISEIGRETAAELKTRYALEYCQTARMAIDLYGNFNEEELDHMIHEASIFFLNQEEAHD